MIPIHINWLYENEELLIKVEFIYPKNIKVLSIIIFSIVNVWDLLIYICPYIYPIYSWFPSDSIPVINMFVKTLSMIMDIVDVSYKPLH